MMLHIFLQAAPVVAATAQPAVQAAGVPSWQYQVVMFILATLGAVLTTAIPLVARHIAKKYKLEGEAKIAERTEALVGLGMQFVEEQVSKRAKAALDKPSSDEKLDMATQFILAQLKDQGLPQRSAASIKNMIEAKLAGSRPTIPPIAVGNGNQGTGG